MKKTRDCSVYPLFFLRFFLIIIVFINIHEMKTNIFAHFIKDKRAVSYFSFGTKCGTLGQLAAAI